MEASSRVRPSLRDGARAITVSVSAATTGAMIAWAGAERLRRGLTDSLDFAPRPRWPLEALGSLESAMEGGDAA